MANILVIEDETNIAFMIRTCLESEGHICNIAHDGQTGLDVFRQWQPDLVILDLMLPGMDGIEVCTRIRQSSILKDPYIMMVTAKGEEIDRIIGFSTGADDYIPKPFSPKELVVRVRALLRRTMREQLSEIIETPHLTINVERREVRLKSLAGKISLIKLSSLEFDMLITLASRPGRVWSRSQLLESVWGQNFYGDERIVDSYVKRIRNKLCTDENTEKTRFIKTVTGVGYCFEDLEVTQ